MSENILKLFENRGLCAQVTRPEELEKLAAKGPVTAYTGFDPTADSLHVGHLLPLMGLARFQRAGHIPVALLGGATALVGDPTGKTEMRRMLGPDDIRQNAEKIKTQMSRFLDADKGALFVNNLDWLGGINYLDLLREVGRNFSVNRMLTAECFKQRLEVGLSFLEFNYMILQSYDFLHLNREINCTLQLGGDDQWSNMLAGMELVRRMEGKEVYCLTYPLLTTRDGKKMGKTEKGAVWLDPEKTSPYEYFQFWRNIPDDKVRDCLAFFTFLEMEEIISIAGPGMDGAGLNAAKERLAHETTRLLHGEEEADKALATAQSAFGGGDGGELPSTVLSLEEVGEGIGILDLLRVCGITQSNGEGRRLIQGGGIKMDGESVAIDTVVTPEQLRGGVELRKGKKVHHLAKLS